MPRRCRARQIIYVASYGADLEEHEFNVAGWGAIKQAIIPSNFRSFAIAHVGFFYRLPRITANDHFRPADLSGRRRYALVSGLDRRDRRGATGREAGLGGVHFGVDRRIAAAV